MSVGTVFASQGGAYTIVLDDGDTIEASLRGRIKKRAKTGGRVVIGDRVEVRPVDDAWTIESVEARETALVRRGRGDQPRVLVANLDRVFAVAALQGPPATHALIDRILVLVESSGMRPALVLNKSDLDGAAEAARTFAPLYESIGYRVLVTSVETGEGMEEMKAEACVGSSAFIGPSGVGKSSLINGLDPSLDLRTGLLSRKTGTGRHTTVGSRLIRLSCGGLVADTPGFSDVALWDVPPEEVGACFPEIVEHSAGCRFRSCTHLHEPDCTVVAAVDAGLIAKSRFDSYRTLRGEAEEQEHRY